MAATVNHLIMDIEGERQRQEKRGKWSRASGEKGNGKSWGKAPVKRPTFVSGTASLKAGGLKRTSVSNAYSSFKADTKGGKREEEGKSAWSITEMPL